MEVLFTQGGIADCKIFNDSDKRIKYIHDINRTLMVVWLKSGRRFCKKMLYKIYIWKGLKNIISIYKWIAES